MKVIDSVSWKLILDILESFQLPLRLRNWITSCITSPMLSISTNGVLEGYFPGATGLRQGDPLSLYLFILVMEFFPDFFSSSLILITSPIILNARTSLSVTSALLTIYSCLAIPIISLSISFIKL